MQEGKVAGCLPVSSGRDSAFALHPGVGSLDGPALGCLGISGPDYSLLAPPDFASPQALRDGLSRPSPARDVRLDLSFDERFCESGGVIASIGPDLQGVNASASECIEKWEQVPALVLVAGGEPDFKR